MTNGKSMFLWQFSGIAERSVGEIAQTLHLGGVETLRIKAFDYVPGGFWMSSYDPSPLAVSSPDKLASLRDAFAAEGIRVVAWGNPHGGKTTWQREADACVACAQVCGEFVFDVEVGSSYWPGWEQRDYETTELLFKDVRDRTPGLKLISCFAGQWDWPSLDPALEIMAKYVDVLDMQSYWEPATVATYAQHVTDMNLTPEIRHTVYFSHIPESLQWVKDQGFKHVGVWDFANMSASRYEALAALEFPGDGDGNVVDPWAGYVFGGDAIPNAMRARADTPATGERTIIDGELVYAVGQSGRKYMWDVFSNHVAVAEPV